MFCVGIFLQHAQQSTNEMVCMVCYTVFAQNRYKNQKYHLIVDMIKYLTFFSFCKNKGACGHMKLQNKSRRRRGILRCLHKEKWHRAAHGMHPVTKKLLHIGLPFLSALFVYIPLRYWFFEAHVLGVARLYQNIFESLLLCLVILVCGALLLEIGTRRQ